VRDLQAEMRLQDGGSEFRGVRTSGTHSIWDPQGVETTAIDRTASRLPETLTLLGADTSAHTKIACMGLAWSHCVNTRILMTRERSVGSAFPSNEEGGGGYQNSERPMGSEPAGDNHVSFFLVCWVLVVSIHLGLLSFFVRKSIQNRNSVTMLATICFSPSYL
jgi:hypothetical protein